MHTKILVIDDDRELCELLRDYLGAEGFTVEAAHDGEEGAQRALQGPWGLIVLDVMLPKLNGFDVLRRIRSGNETPVLMLTARGDEIDRIVGLEMGADDYLPKPFNPRELVARLRAIQRRAASAALAVPAPESLLAGDILLDPGTRSVSRAGVKIDVTSVEFSVLEVLLRMAGTVISREELCLQALGRRLSYQDRSIDVHVSSLRKKLGPAEGGGERIKSVRGIGYLYASPSPESRRRR
ncbi:MAG: response regulator transcription factor [Geobacteraceae bacterium]|nr:response regulator transcription factor [Geobacteraceae bacterium]